MRNPARTVPRAIAAAMLGITTLYVLLQVSAQGILGSELATGSPARLADAAGASMGVRAQRSVGWGGDFDVRLSGWHDALDAADNLCLCA